MLYEEKRKELIETARKMEDEAQAERIASREEVKKARQEVYDETVAQFGNHQLYR